MLLSIGREFRAVNVINIIPNPNVYQSQQV